MKAANWILRNGMQRHECLTFPFAFRSMFNIVRKGLETGKESLSEMIPKLSIIGPPNAKGERKTYNYSSAMEMAKCQGLITSDGQINSKEFKRSR